MKKQSMIRKIINLSPLVDIFMIVIFWYIMFSSQNIQNQDAKFQLEIEGLTDELEELKDELKKQKEQNEKLEAENKRLDGLLDQEGQSLVIQISGGTSNTRSLELTWAKDQKAWIYFTNEERENGTLEKRLREAVLSGLGDGKLYLFFFRDSRNTLLYDTEGIGAILDRLEAEEPAIRCSLMDIPQ